MVEATLILFTLMLDAEKQFVKDAACSLSNIQFQSYASSINGMTIYYQDGSQLVRQGDNLIIYDAGMNERFKQ